MAMVSLTPKHWNSKLPCATQLLPQILFYPRDNNAVIHLCFDNFDLDEETPSGSGTTHSTHGIVIQEVLDPDRQPILTETQPTPRSKQRSVKPVEIEIRP